MPIQGTELYPLRWWYRADINSSQPVFSNVISTSLVTLVPELPKLVPLPIGSQPVVSAKKK
jgi:hypothetical protein